jgi:eukaryotic-like serine/threonine-protein kinase
MRPGTVIASRFRIQRLAGSGGMGAVYHARDLVRNVDVAVKVDHHAGDGPEARRIAREAEILAERLASLRHPHIVEYVAHGVTDQSQPYLVMEWLDGHDLGVHVRRAPLAEADVMALGLRIASALAVIHGCGVVHRDVKPGNLFLVGGDLARVKLIDFGLVRVEAALTELTQSGVLMGTPGFIAPEQIKEAGAVDGRADLYALGAVLFACLTQRPPFVGVHVMAVLGKLWLEEAPRVRELRGDVSPELDELIGRLLSKRPSDRPASADELASELGALLARQIDRLSPQDAARAHAQLAPGAVSSGEQRFLTVLMAGPLPAVVFTVADPASLVAGFGAEAVLLADGTLLAAFAAGNAPDDTAARAARCALALRQAGVLAPMVLATGRGRMDARLPVGEVIERAVALRFGQAASPAGRSADTGSDTLPGALHEGIAVDDVTAGLIQGRFQLDHDPGRGYRLQAESAAPQAVRGLGGTRGPCVGRERELGALEGLFDECTDESTPRIAMLIGPAGAGKSRLAHELVQRLEARSTAAPVAWRAAGDPMREGSSLGLLARLLAHAAGVSPESEPAERRAALARRVGAALGAAGAGAAGAGAAGAGAAGAGAAAAAERIAVFLSEIAAAPYPDEVDLQLREARRDPRLMHDQMRRAWEDWLDAEAASAPLLLLLDDLQWADAPSVRFIDAALRNLAHRPVFVVALARPEIDDSFPELWAARQPDRMALRPLSRRACTLLAQHHAPAALTPEDLERLVDRAAGNPFYLEELLRHARASDEALPDTVLALVGVRLAALPAEERRALRAASVFGRSFWIDGVAALLGDESGGAAVTRSLVERLLARDLVQPERQARLAGSDAFRFQHELVREAAYAMLPFEDCVRAHRLAGAWLERAGQRDAHVLAEHYRRGQAPDLALPWFVRAAEQALEADDVQAVVERVEQAVACGAGGETLGALRLLQAEAQNWGSQHAAAYHAASAAMARLSYGSDAWAQAAHQLSWAAVAAGNIEAVVRVADQLVGLDGPLGDGVAVAMSYCATHLLACRRHAEAGAFMDRLDAQAHAHVPSVAGAILHLRAFRAWIEGRLDLAVIWFGRAVEQWELAGNTRQACLDRTNLGMGLRILGQYEDSVAVLQRSLDQGRRLGVEHLVSTSTSELALALGRLGQLDEALELVSGPLPSSLRERTTRVNTRAWLALLGSRPADALAELERSELDADEPPTGDALAQAMAVRAGALLGLDRPYEALDAARAGMDILAAAGTLEDGEALLRMAHAEALHATGARARARVAMDETHAWMCAQAMQIDNPDWRETFLDRVAEHQRIAELARAWAAEPGREHG